MKRFIFATCVFFITAIFAEEKNIYLAEKVAAGNDWLINEGQKSTILEPVTWATSRAMSLTLFPLCTAVDMALITANQAAEVPFILLDQDPSKVHLKKYRKNSELLKKKSLGLLTSPLGVLSPDLVTHHFVPSTIQATELVPYGKLYKTHAHIVYPESLGDVQLIIQEAKRSHKTISVIGKGMSQGKQAISNNNWNVVIDTSKLNQVAIDPGLKIARVSAGASWEELQRAANGYGLAVRVMQASNIFSVGGSISVNCHGWDYKTGSLRNTLLSLVIVDAEGRVLTITPDDPLFDYVVGGYGGFGVIVEAEISLTDNLEIAESGVEIAPEYYVDYFYQNIRHNPAIDMHLYRLSLKPNQLFKTGIAVDYQRTSDRPIVAPLVDEPERGSRKDRILLHAIRRLPFLRSFAWNKEKNEALAEKISSRNEIMRPPIRPVFNHSKIDTEWLQEYFVKGEDLAGFLRFLGNILQKNNVPLFNASVRFVPHDPKTKLSYAAEGDRFAVVLFFNQKLSPKEVEKTKLWVRKVIDYLVQRGGTYYLPYQHFATLDQFRAVYPKWKAVLTYKNLVDPEGLFDSGLYSDYFTFDDHQNALFRKVFNRMGGQREGIKDFLKNVFMQLDENKFFHLMDSILEDPKLNDEQIYATLYQRIGEAKPDPISLLSYTLKSLDCLKQEIGDQTAELVGKKKINGYVEIGYPGRMVRSLKDRLNLEGRIYAVIEQESFTDYIEAGFPRPYDQFIPINDYVPIAEVAIPANSVDLVCMYIGLHHIPEDKIDPFIASIQRTLRPGGIFILMDHDAYTQGLKDFVDIVHSIFNAGTGVEPNINRQEIRNFHSLHYWIGRVEAQGLVVNSKEPLIRKGDSTLNSLLRFDKPHPYLTQETIVNDLIQYPEYNRPLAQTYLTAPEWQNVRAAQRYAAFVKEKPACRYPFFSEIGGFWEVYGNSWQEAQKEEGFWGVALSEYNLMNLFVGTTMTLEYGAKGLIAAPFKILDQTASPLLDKTPADDERAIALEEYGNYIENTPFYKYPYFKDIGSYWKTYFNENKSLRARLKGGLVGAGMTIEYGIKGILSAPMALIFGSEALKEAETIQLLITDPLERIESIDPDIIVLQNYPELGLRYIKMPRYMRFTELMQKIANDPQISCVNIAGHDKIQMDVRSKYSFTNNYSGVRKIYDIPVPGDQEFSYTALEVDVPHLCQVIRTLQNHHMEILFIHDY